MFSLESPHRGESNEHTQYTIFNIKRKSPLIIPDLPLLDFFQGTQERFRNSCVDEPPVFEPLKVYSIVYLNVTSQISSRPHADDPKYTFRIHCKLHVPMKDNQTPDPRAGVPRASTRPHVN